MPSRHDLYFESGRNFVDISELEREKVSKLEVEETMTVIKKQKKCSGYGLTRKRRFSDD